MEGPRNMSDQVNYEQAVIRMLQGRIGELTGAYERQVVELRVEILFYQQRISELELGGQNSDDALQRAGEEESPVDL